MDPALLARDRHRRPDGKAAVANPYGYVEEVSLGEFLDRTRFDAYEGMPLPLKFGFAFGVFEKNTAFVPERASQRYGVATGLTQSKRLAEHALHIGTAWNRHRLSTSYAVRLYID